MFRLLVVGIVICLSQLSCKSSTSSHLSAEKSQFHNNQHLVDTSGQKMIHNGGSFFKEGKWFYWVGFNQGQQSPDISLYRSEDLINWEHRGKLVDTNAMLMRPALVKGKSGIYTLFVKTGGRFVVYTSKNIEGPYQKKNDGWRPAGKTVQDFSIWQESSEKAVVVSHLYDLEKNPSGGKKHYLATFMLKNGDFSEFASYDAQGNPNSSWMIATGNREAPSMIKRQGTYYITTSGTKGWKPSGTYYYTSTAIDGKFTHRGLVSYSSIKAKSGNLVSNPSKDSFFSQHDFMYNIPGTKEFIYVGDRFPTMDGKKFFDVAPFNGKNPYLSRNIFLPVSWVKQKNGPDKPQVNWVESWNPLE